VYGRQGLDLDFAHFCTFFDVGAKKNCGSTTHKTHSVAAADRQVRRKACLAKGLPRVRARRVERGFERHAMVRDSAT
jgi:uncharacterized Zn finger protein